jgi:hypothetical protein
VGGWIFGYGWKWNVEGHASRDRDMWRLKRMKKRGENKKK